MTYAIDLSTQIIATRQLAKQIRRIAALISLDDERARLLGHAEELDRHADDQERQPAVTPPAPPLHLATVSG